MNFRSFVIGAVIYIALWAANYVIEKRRLKREPTFVELIFSGVGFVGGLLGLALLFRNWNAIKANPDPYLFWAGAAFCVVIGVITEVLFTTVGEGKRFSDIKTLPLVVALLSTAPIFLGILSTMKEPNQVHNLLFAFTSGFGWKGLWTQGRKAAEANNAVTTDFKVPVGGKSRTVEMTPPRLE
jgi:drug/metabolite transporter (DMT)-like permease